MLSLIETEPKRADPNADKQIKLWDIYNILLIRKLRFFFLMWIFLNIIQERGALCGAPFLLLLNESTNPGRKPLPFFFLFTTSDSLEIPELPMVSLEHDEPLNWSWSSRMKLGVMWLSSSMTSELSILNPSNCENANSDSSILYRIAERSSPCSTKWSTCVFMSSHHMEKINLGFHWKIW